MERVITSKISGRVLDSAGVFNNGLKTCAIIDGNNFCIRAFYSSGGSKSPDYFLINCFKIIVKLVERLNVDLFIFVFDGGRVWRTNLHRENANNWLSETSRLGYKGNRTLHASEDYVTIKHYMHVFKRFILTKLHIPNITVQDVEADDVVYWISKHLTGVNKLIVSADEDLIQSCKFDTTAWYTPVKDQYVTKFNFKNYNGYDLERYVDLKAIIGDTSDNIEGIKGLAAATLHRWYKRSGEYPFDPFAWLKKYGEPNEKLKFLTPRHMQNWKVSRMLIDAEVFANLWDGLDIKRFHSALAYIKAMSYKEIYDVISATGVKTFAPSKVSELEACLARCKKTIDYLRRSVWKKV